MRVSTTDREPEKQARQGEAQSSDTSKPFSCRRALARGLHDALTSLHDSGSHTCKAKKRQVLIVADGGDDAAALMWAIAARDQVEIVGVAPSAGSHLRCAGSNQSARRAALRPRRGSPLGHEAGKAIGPRNHPRSRGADADLVTAQARTPTTAERQMLSECSRRQKSIRCHASASELVILWENRRRSGSSPSRNVSWARTASGASWELRRKRRRIEPQRRALRGGSKTRARIVQPATRVPLPIQGHCADEEDITRLYLATTCARTKFGTQ